MGLTDQREDSGVTTLYSRSSSWGCVVGAVYRFLDFDLRSFGHLSASVVHPVTVFSLFRADQERLYLVRGLLGLGLTSSFEFNFRLLPYHIFFFDCLTGGFVLLRIGIMGTDQSCLFVCSFASKNHASFSSSLMSLFCCLLLL